MLCRLTWLQRKLSELGLKRRGQLETPLQKLIEALHPFSNGCRASITRTAATLDEPLKPVIQETEECRLKLGHEEVRKLRKEDGSLWTVNTLAKYFSTLPSVIRRVSSADPKRQKELDEEKASLAKMRPHKRKMYKLEKQLMRAARLKELLQQRAPLAAKVT
ncbi:hypothetical protein EMCRGX_G028239 [Ephydatia muelleri]|eukprot:Em0020g425a